MTQRAITSRDLPSIAFRRCPCGGRRRPEAQIDGLAYSLTCPRCSRVTSGFTWAEAIAAWNGESLARPSPRKFVACAVRVDFEADHPGPFDHICDAEGNELEEYASQRTQADWLLWLRAQAGLAQEIDRLSNEVKRLSELKEAV